MIDETFPGELSGLLKARARSNFALAMINFKIGKLVHKTIEEGGEEAVKRLAALCPGGSVVFERFLLDASRVYRSIKNPGFLFAMKKKLGDNLTWGFLLTNCTKAPEGDTEEANLFWERKLEQIENALADLESGYENLPANIREQLDGLLHAATGSVESREGGKREVLGGTITFGHIADIQMCEGFTTAGRLIIDPETGKNERLLDIHRCLDYAIDTMVEKGCRVIFVAGDLTETEKPTPNEQGFLRVSLEKAARKCPVIAILGNHDLSKNPKDACSLEFLKGRHNIYVIERPSVLYLEGDTVNETPSETWPQPDCMKIFVLPFPSKSIAGGEAEGKSIAELNKLVSNKLRVVLESFRSEIDHRVPNALLAHITVAGAEGATNDQMLMFDPNLLPLDLAGFDYVALGHLHKFQRVGENAYYSGSIDRMDFNEEEDQKGFIIGTFEGKDAMVEFIETPARRFETLTPEFLESPIWEEQVDERTIYRIRGEVAKEQYEALKPLIREFPVPLLNKLTVKREVRVRDIGMTDELKEEDALARYLDMQGIPQELLFQCLQAHTDLLVETGSKG